MNIKNYSKFKLFIFLLTLVFLAGTYSDYFQSIENKGYQLIARFINGAKSSPRALVLAIDTDSLQQFGDWPWSRARLSRLVSRLQKHNPRSITLAVDLSTPQLAKRPGPDFVSGADPQQKPLKRKILQAIYRLDVDQRLANVIGKAGNVIISAGYWSTQFDTEAPASLKNKTLRVKAASEGLAAWLQRLALRSPETKAVKIQPPLALFNAKARMTALMPLNPPSKESLYIPLVVRAKDQYFPHTVLASYLVSRGRSPAKTWVVPPNRIGGRRYGLSTGPAFRFYPLPVSAWKNRPPVKTLSVADFLNNKFKTRIRGRAVFIGLTAPALSRMIKTVDGTLLPQVSWQAYAAHGLLSGQSINVPYWFYGAQRALIVVFMIYLLLTPRPLHGRIGFLITMIIVAAALNLELIALLTQRLWLPMVFPSLFLLVTHALIGLSYRKSRMIEKAQLQTSSVRKELGAYYQSQSNLNKAFEHLKLCHNDGQLPKLLYNLGLDFERRRQFDKALEVYEHIHQHLGAFYKDSESRIAHLMKVTNHFPISGPSATATTQILSLTESGVEKPMLGRYQLVREIGRGAMGMVYLGRDPKIGREVAIKTLALSAEFEGKELEESEQRFLREAEAVGRLNHMNIVTIYDVGEDQGLAYIAMDYVEGVSLDHHIAKGALLKIRTIIEVCAQVADALAYAHKKKVIHRDVKPANIIYNANTKTVKVTDFGIASLTDDTKTRTGTILGSPSYMSPEQISGKKVAGTSDQFSLGVTMYQLLSGTLPFDGDSMANLMYQITNQPHKPIRKLRRGITPCISRVINKSLQKLPENRFADCSAMADALRRCLEQD